MTNPKPYTSSSLPLDMGQFNAVTEGKGTHKEELLELFFTNSGECIVVMERHIENGNEEKWQSALEELKNISASIGALELSKICAVAGKVSGAKLEDKQKILESVKMHIQRLQAFVRNTR